MKKSKYTLYKRNFWGRPVVNFHDKRVFMNSQEKELLVYNFAGHLLDELPIESDVVGRVSCGGYGVVLIRTAS